jgi:hypothetical protein
MNDFLKAIFFEQANTASKMLARLKLPGITQLIDKAFLKRAIDDLDRLHSDIHKLIQSGDLDVPGLQNSNIVKYNTFTERLQTIELFQYLVIVNYGQAEEYFKKKITRIYKEINCLQSEPVVTTISNSESYYWALPTYNIIAVPSGEEKNLLNLPDLYHEIGHLIDLQFRATLIGDFEQILARFYKSEIQRVIDEQRDLRLISFYQEKQSRWLNGWIMEFVCDFIATYFVGPAYAYTNLKISTHSSGKDRIYADIPSHPSDESRMKAIFYMLKKLGFDQEVAQINKSWHDFLTITRNPIPPNYAYIFPQTMIEALGDRIFKGCQQIDLRSYPEQIKKFGKPISKVINDAWGTALSSGHNFKDWEEKEIKEIGGII